MIGLVLLVLPLQSEAIEYSGGFRSGILTYGVGTGSASLASSAASQWNGISSKVSLTYSSGSNQYGSTADIVTHFDASGPPTSGYIGITYYYKSWNGTSAQSATTYDTWVKATVHQFKTDSMDTTDKKLKTSVHEFGHALSLGHPTTSILSVMQQGVSTSYQPKTYDKTSLRQKWGN